MKYNPLIHHCRSIRLKGYDYSQAGAYFITICTKQMEHLFGEVIDDEMILNDMGKIAYNEWLKTPELRPNVSLDVFQIMPNHMHGIIIIKLTDDIDKFTRPMDDIDNLTSPGELHSPSTPATHITKFESPSNNIGAIVRGYKSAVTKQINLLNHSGTAWHRDYYEHIIRNEQSYWLISDYIINNPKKWNEDKFRRK